MKTDDFVPHGYGYINCISTEIQISDCADGARYRLYIPTVIDTKIIKGKWQPVRFDKDGRAYIRDWHGNAPSGIPGRTYKKLYIDMFMAYQDRIADVCSIRDNSVNNVELVTVKS